jgi:hypothetical protein
MTLQDQTTERKQLVLTIEDPRNRMIDDFCAIENICTTEYYTMKKRGHGPAELRIPESRVVRITQAAHLEWRQRMAELAASKAGELETERRRELASVAGKHAAASSTHVSKRRRA